MDISKLQLQVVLKDKDGRHQMDSKNKYPMVHKATLKNNNELEFFFKDNGDDFTPKTIVIAGKMTSGTASELFGFITCTTK